MDLDVLKVKFTHSNTVRDKKPYTIYEIEVRSSSTITWVIYKRYSSFHQLHQELIKAPSSQISNDQKAALPMLPPKRLTRSLAVEFVEKRKNELQDYLRAMLETPGLVHSPIILAFLEVPDSVRPMLAAAMHHHQQSGGAASQAAMGGYSDSGSKDYLDGSMSSSAAAKVSYASKSPDERRILELLNLLRFHPNKVTALKGFEEWFFDNRPRLSTEYIRLLLQGSAKGGGDGDGGLLQTIGDVAYSHVASRAALYLLSRLLDVEKNKDATLFLEQFVSLDVSVLKRMHIGQHILSERGNRIGAFKIIQILRNANVGGGGMGGGGGLAVTGGASGSSRVDLQLEQIVNDSWALREYYKWAERKSDTSGQIVPFNHYGAQNKDNIFMKSLNLTSPTAAATAAAAQAQAAATGTAAAASADAPAASGGDGGASGMLGESDVSQIKFLRSKISDIFQDMKRLLEEREVLVSGADGNPMSPAVNSSRSSSDAGSCGVVTPWRLVSLVPQFDLSGRALSSGVESLDEDVSLLYRKNIKEDMVIVKMQCIVPYRMEEVAPFLADLRRRKEWDLKYHKGKCLEVRQSQEYASVSGHPHPLPLQYPEYQSDIVHMVFKSFSSPYKYRDVVVLRSFANIDKTRAEFEQQGFKQRQQLANGGTTSGGGAAAAAAAAAVAAAASASSSHDDAHDVGGAGRECEEPIFKEGAFQDGAMLFGTRSVIHPAGPEFKDNVRAVLYPSGYILVPLRDQSVDVHPLAGSAASAPVQTVSDLGCACQLTFVTQMDRESVLIFSPDLLGETNELRQSFNNIKACLARDYGLRTLRPSRHTQQLRALAGRAEESQQQAQAAGGAQAQAPAHMHMQMQSMHTHTRTPSVLASHHPTPITYQQRHAPPVAADGAGDAADAHSRSASVAQSPSRSNSTAQPSPQQRGTGLPVIREQR